MNNPSVVKKRKLTNSLAYKQTSHSPKLGSISSKSAFLSQATKWNLEQDYERKPRKGKKNERETTRLPIKTSDGLIKQVPVDTFMDEIKIRPRSPSIQNSETDDSNATSPPLIPTGNQIIEAQEELARIALLLKENDPEEHVGSLKALAQYGQSSNSTIVRLALLTQLAVYKDLIPGYRIRQLSKEEMTTKVSKDVKKLRAYEQTLVAGYQKYVQDISKFARGHTNILGGKISNLGNVAISCACNLLISVPHFNFRGELIKIIVKTLSLNKVNQDFIRCHETIQKLFQEDEDGGPSLDVVTNLAKMIKERGYSVDESVLNLFLHLRLLNEFSWKGSIHHIDKPKKDESSGKVLKEKRVFRTKKERKLMKERKILEAEMKVADASVSHEEKDRMQAETLKRVFLTYFWILKQKSPGLIGASLEGLARYAHLINQDFFGDLLEVLKDLVSQTELEADSGLDDMEESKTDQDITRQALLCITTAFALLQGQDVLKAQSSLNLDLGFFTSHLYKNFYELSLNPDIELSSKSLNFLESSKAMSSSATRRINFQTTTVLFIRAISSVIVPTVAARAVPPARIAAFSKQLLTICLQLPEKSCFAIISLMEKVTKIHGKKIASLWNTEERRGDGIFNPLSSDAEGSNPFAATIWEGELLRKHFSPTVRNSVKLMEKNILELI